MWAIFLPRLAIPLILIFNFACWNIKGLNGTPKQSATKKMISELKLYLVCVVETRV